MPGRSRAAHVLLLCVACDGFVVPRNRRAFVQQRNQVRMMSDPEQIEKLQEQAAKLRDEVAAMEAEVRANRKPEPESASNIAPSPAPVTPAPVPNKDEGWLNGLGALFDRDDEQIGEVPAPAPRPMLNNDDEISAGDRALASAAFLLPYFDGITFGTCATTAPPRALAPPRDI